MLVVELAYQNVTRQVPGSMNHFSGSTIELEMVPEIKTISRK